MSGGSFNYLCRCEPEDLVSRLADMNDMAAALTDLGFDDAAGETEELVRMIRHFLRQSEARMPHLLPVWKAVEWKRSGDWGAEQLEETISTYRGQPKDVADE